MTTLTVMFYKNGVTGALHSYDIQCSDTDWQSDQATIHGFWLNALKPEYHVTVVEKNVEGQK